MKRASAGDDTQRRSAYSPVETASDEELLLGYRFTGNEQMFAELLRRYERPLLRHLQRVLKNDTTAEDVLQDTFLQLHLKADRFSPERKVRPWLYSVATHQAIDYLRRNRRHQAVSLSQASDGHEGALANAISLADEGLSALDQLDASTKREWVRRAVHALPQLFRQVFVRVHFEGCTYLETARELGVPVGTVKSRNHTALMKLMGAWQQRRRCLTERN